MPIRAALLGLIAATAVSGAAFAGSCVGGSISTYLTMAEGGTAPDGFSCTVGDKSFSNFTFTSTGGGSGSAVTPAEFNVSPQLTLVGPGLLFSSGAIEIDNNVPNPMLSFVDVSLGYSVTAPNPPLIEDADLVVAGGTTGGGTARVDETLTPGGTLTVILPTTNDTVNFTPVAGLDVLKDILVEVPANTVGTANITAIGQHYSETPILEPEPTTLAIIGVGLLGFSIARRRRGA